MSSALIVAIGALLAGPLIGFLAATRKLSGKIGTSDATELWKAAEAMRKEYRDDLLASNKRVVALETRVANLEGLNNDLSRANTVLKQRVAALEDENAELIAKVGRLERELHEERNGHAN